MTDTTDDEWRAYYDSDDLRRSKRGADIARAALLGPGQGKSPGPEVIARNAADCQALRILGFTVSNASDFDDSTEGVPTDA